MARGMRARRVVTGHPPAGKAVVASDAEVDGIAVGALGSEFHRLWGADSVSRFPDDGSMHPAPRRMVVFLLGAERTK
jgi:hypothetical protein